MGKMMNNKTLGWYGIAAMVCLTLAASGCGSLGLEDKSKKEYSYAERLKLTSNVKKGQTINEVKDILGKPTSLSSEPTGIQKLDYVDEHDSDNFIWIYFKEGKCIYGVSLKSMAPTVFVK